MTVNPKMLVWAREERGMSLEGAAEKLGVEAAQLKKWENDGQGVAFNILESIAKAYKRQTAVFFLPAVPPKAKRPKDCRNLAGARGLFSVETLLAIRRADRYLQVARELGDASYWNEQYAWTKEFSGKPSNVNEEAARMRAVLTSQSDSIVQPGKADEAFRYWRNKIEEKLGIFVFQFAMPENEIDGFSYAFDAPPHGIVVNNKNQPVRKIFTLFHELAHILRHEPGVCQTGYIDEEQQFKIELECNKFAGKLLAPVGKLKAAHSVDEIFDLARTFNISGEAYLRRLHEENKISQNSFFNLLGPVREKSNSLPRKKKKKDSPIAGVILSKSTRGRKFFNLVATAATSNRMSFSAASDLLGLKVGNIRV